MPPRFAPTGDPRLKTYSWAGIKRHWRKQREAQCQAGRCLLPGVPIRYDGPRGPDSLDVGHRLGRDVDPRHEWTVDETRPEHQRCNRSAGATYGNRKRGLRVIIDITPRQTRAW